MKNPIRVGLIGAGVVGAGVLYLLKKNRQIIDGRSSRPLSLVSVCDRNIKRVEAMVSEAVYVTDNPEEIVTDPNLHVVIETMGGIEPARTLILQAIATGKHIITANKALLALHGKEIFEAAQERGVHVFFEAAVGAAVPILKTLKESLAANEIEWIAGIINGTCNYILTQMTQTQQSFAQALAEAQKLGYAESDPTLDINGTDSAHKLTILASIAYGVPVDFQRVYREGIESIEQKDIRYVDSLGYGIKLLGIVKKTEQGVQLRVHPTLVPRDSLLYPVQGVMNGMLVHTDAAGSMMLYGRGAGSLPTASAIVADLIEMARLQSTDAQYRVPHLGSYPDTLQPVQFIPMEEVKCSYYLRLSVKDEPAVLAGITHVMAKYGISISSLLQPENPDETHLADVVFLTHDTTEKNMLKAIAEMQQLPFVATLITFIRKEMLV
jgi:homoserine dehydrogenase